MQQRSNPNSRQNQAKGASGRPAGSYKSGGGGQQGQGRQQDHGRQSNGGGKPQGQGRYQNESRPQNLGGNRNGNQSFGGGRPSRDGDHAGQASQVLSRQERELLEELLDDMYEDFADYKRMTKPGEEMNATYQTFVNITRKLGLRQPK
ncbi:hypothetical protein [Brevibacillus dissolubilis]|uniref:hypothetical protein n=1 Tax=Brevibacillus dissolubilis TaxID=1844116 RepID=UPI00111758E6|nr:hypothetical protein [Brevibacillus dissolubilis]